MDFKSIELDEETKRMHRLRKEYLYLMMYGGSPKLDPCVPVLYPLCDFCNAPLDMLIEVDGKAWCGSCHD